MPETAPTKPGVKTTEFWSTQITAGVLILNSVTDGPLEISDAATAALAAGIVAAYTIGRAIVKAFGN